MNGEKCNIISSLFDRILGNGNKSAGYEKLSCTGIFSSYSCVSNMCEHVRTLGDLKKVRFFYDFILCWNKCEYENVAAS